MRRSVELKAGIFESLHVEVGDAQGVARALEEIAEENLQLAVLDVDFDHRRVSQGPAFVVF